MPITYDITRDKLYLRGVKAGEEKAKRKAEERAEKIVREQVETTQRTVIERMLAMKQLTMDQIAEIAGVSVDVVQKVQQTMDG